MTGPDVIRRLADPAGGDRRLVGGKAASLGQLARAGFPVPDGYVVTTAAFPRLPAAPGPGPGPGPGRPASGPAGLEQAAADIRRRIEQAVLPPGLVAAIAEHYRALGQPPVAVRSSGTAEDSSDASFAGTADSYLWVRGPDADTRQVRQCWASLYSFEAVSYRRRLGLPEAGLAMAVLIQRMIDARCSGVLFTRSPATGDRSVIAVEASWGLGTAIVGGAVTPDSYLVSKVTGEIIRRQVAVKQWQDVVAPGGHRIVKAEVPADQRDRPCLSDEDIDALAQLGRRVEDHYGVPQDIEWAIARGQPPGQGIFLLQSRPETVWAHRESGPAARPKPRPFGHVVELLSKNQPA
jgi:pyruvate,water dikinase